MAEESWLWDREKVDELSKAVRRLMAGFQTKKEVKEMEEVYMLDRKKLDEIRKAVKMLLVKFQTKKEVKVVEKEDCPICWLQLPYMAYHDWNAQPIGLEKSEVLDKSKCSELEFKLVSFAPMTDIAGYVELTAPAMKYVHKSCAERILENKQEKVYTFQWLCPYDDLALIVRRK